MIRILILFIILTFVSCYQSNSDKNLNQSINTDTKDFEKTGFDLMNSENLGKLKLGLNVIEVTKILGEPGGKTENELWEADGAYHQTFKYPGLGIELDMIEEPESEKVINMITVVSPCTFKTNNGISVGSNYSEVEKAYKKSINPEFSNTTTIVAGSVYGGVIFSFENGKVKSIYIGASAE